MEEVVPFRTGYGSGLCAAWYDGSFLFVLFTLSSGADGHVSGTVDYDVFGKPVTETGVFAGSAGGSGGISALVFAYAGKPYDPVTGLSDYGFRDYASGLARFTTVDPIRDGSNWYAYCNSDPVNYVDAWGLTASDSEGRSDSSQQNIQQTTSVVVNIQTPTNSDDYHCDILSWNQALEFGADPRDQNEEAWNGNDLTVPQIFDRYPNNRNAGSPQNNTRGYSFYDSPNDDDDIPEHMEFYDATDSEDGSYILYRTDGINTPIPVQRSGTDNNRTFIPLNDLTGDRN